MTTLEFTDSEIKVLKTEVGTLIRKYKGKQSNRSPYSTNKEQAIFKKLEEFWKKVEHKIND